MEGNTVAKNIFYGQYKGGESRDFFAVNLYPFRTEWIRKTFIFFFYFSMNFHAVKWRNLVFIRSDGISKCFMLHKFEQRLSYIARACDEKYIGLENDS